MALVGITFDNQAVLSKFDGAFYQVMNNRNSDWRIRGAACTISNNTLTIANGYLLIGGRLIQVDGTTTYSLSPTIANGYGRVKVVIDLTQTATEETFNQVRLEEDYNSTESGFPALTKGDINMSGTKYEAMLCIFPVTNSQAGTIRQTMPLHGGFLEKAGGAVTGPINSSGNNTFSGSNTFSGGTTFSGGMTSSGNNTFSGRNTFSRQIVANGGLDVNGATDFNPAPTINNQSLAAYLGLANKANAGFGTLQEADLDNVTTSGWYWVNPSTTTTHLPISEYGFLEVLTATGSNQGNKLQRFTTYAGNQGKHRIFERIYTNSRWFGWTEIDTGPRIVRLSYTMEGQAGAWDSCTYSSKEVLSGPDFTSGTPASQYQKVTIPGGTYRITVAGASSYTGAEQRVVGIGLAANATASVLLPSYKSGAVITTYTSSAGITRLSASGILVIDSPRPVGLVYWKSATDGLSDAAWLILEKIR